MAVEARVVASLQSSQGSRVPVAVGVYNGELIVVCPGGQGETKISSKSSLAVHRVYNPTKEVSTCAGQGNSHFVDSLLRVDSLDQND